MKRFKEINTPYENKWLNMPDSHRLVAGRETKYDSNTGILYYPTIYKNERILPVKDETLKDEWIIDNFRSFVRGEFGNRNFFKGSPPSMKKIKTVDTNPLDIARRYLENCEKELVYSGLVDGIRDFAGSDMAIQIYHILCNPRLGNKKNKQNVAFDDFENKIAALLRNKDRLRFIFPAFPFKDQNIFRTCCPPNHIDMAEIAMIIRLHIVSLAIYQVHPYGADWIILSDGMAYSDILGISKEDTLEYRAKLIQARNELNLNHTVQILDLKSLANKISGENSGSELFNKTTEHISRKLQGMHTEDYLVDHFRVLVRGMKWNRSLKTFFDNNSIDFNHAWELLNAETREDVSTKKLKGMWDKLDEIGVETAINYAAFNLALKYHSVIETFFPDAIRATMHPKKGQMGVPSMGSVYPWNGVCLANNLECRPTSFESIELYKLMGNIDSIKGYCNRDSSYPFFYYQN